MLLQVSHQRSIQGKGHQTTLGLSERLGCNPSRFEEDVDLSPADRTRLVGQTYERSLGQPVCPGHQTMGLARVQRHPMLEQGGERGIAVPAEGLGLPGLGEEASYPGVVPITSSEQ